MMSASRCTDCRVGHMVCMQYVGPCGLRSESLRWRTICMQDCWIERCTRNVHKRSPLRMLRIWNYDVMITSRKMSTRVVVNSNSWVQHILNIISPVHHVPCATSAINTTLSPPLGNSTIYCRHLSDAARN